MTNSNPNTNRTRTFRVSFDITITDNPDSNYANNVNSWVWDAIFENLEKGEEITGWDCKEINPPEDAKQMWFDPSWQEDDGA